MFSRLKLRTKIILGFIIVILPIFVMSYFFISGLNKIAEPINQDISESVKTLSATSELDSLAQFIRYYDEVLTQSARNYAFTGNIKWKDKYYENVPKLNADIKQAIQKGDEEDKRFFNDVDAANIALVEMEEESISFADAGDLESAIDILESVEYAKQKEIYKNGLVAYVARRGAEYDESLTASTYTLEQAALTSKNLIQQNITLALIILAGAILWAVILGFIISFLITRPLSNLKNTAEEISAGDLSQRVVVPSQDEIGDLASSFNLMADKLQKNQQNIEKRINERTATLEKLNKAMVGRELKMMELKKKIEELSKK